MLAVRLLCVGRLGEKFWTQACAEYVKRLSAYCKLEIIEIPEERLPPDPSEAQIVTALKKEGELLRAKLPSGAQLIAFCIEGKELSSPAFADWLTERQNRGMSKLCLMIGGSCGLDESLKKEATLRLSMSPMTFPHHLARVMALEQIYRAFSIMNGGKYHK